MVVRSGGGVSRRSNSGGAEDEELFHSCPTVESIFFKKNFFGFGCRVLWVLASGSGLNLKGRYFWLRYGAKKKKKKTNECLKKEEDNNLYKNKYYNHCQEILKYCQIYLTLKKSE